MTSISLVVPAARVREVKVLLEERGFLAGKIRKVDGSDGGGFCIPTSLVGGCPTSTTSITPSTASTSGNGDGDDNDNDGDDRDEDGDADFDGEEKERIFHTLGIQDGRGITITPVTTIITTGIVTHDGRKANPPENPLQTAITTFLTANPPEDPTILPTLLSTLPKRYTYTPPLLPPQQPPPRSDFDEALWTSTRQSGILQIWAPGYTMFSRGNVKEKARILRFPPPATGTGTKWAVDMYAGIGYFAFSYAKLGYRVLAWEINPWSVEGFVRGAGENGLPVKVVLPHQDVPVTVERQREEGAVVAVVFMEDNENAPARIAKMGEGVRGGIERVNLGLLPTSRGSWARAIQVLAEQGGWVHVHENVGIGEIDGMAERVVKAFEELEKGRGSTRRVVCEHVERVKTFAPGVMHCVFDIRIGGERL